MGDSPEYTVHGVIVRHGLNSYFRHVSRASQITIRHGIAYGVTRREMITHILEALGPFQTPSIKKHKKKKMIVFLA